MDRGVAQIANMRWPSQGAKALPLVLDFSGGATEIDSDTFFEQSQGLIEFIQSVFIDNSGNGDTFTLTTILAGVAVSIIAQPFTQGYYPVMVDTGTARIAAKTVGGVKVTVALLNVAMPYFVWGPK